MYKAVGFWSWPSEEDQEAFEQHYEAVHFPLAEKLPGLRRITVVTAAGEGAREAGIFRIAEVYWEDRAAFERAAESAEWQAMATDAMGMMERFGVTLASANGEETDVAY